MRIVVIAGLMGLLSWLPFMTAHADNGCDPVATLFAQTLCRQDFREETTDYLDAMKVPTDQRPVMIAQIEQRNRRQVMDLLWQLALAQKFGAEAITPDEKTIERFQSHFHASMDASYAADKQAVIYLRDILEKNTFDEDVTAQIKDIVKAMETGIHFYEERERQIAALPADYTFVTKSAESEVSRGLIRHWNADQLLFKTYGGRLIMGQNGPEPVDAYKDFLAYIEENGNFEAQDPAYSDIFAEIRQHINTKEEPVPTDSDMYKYYFTDPTWQFSLSNSENRLDDLRKWIEGLPRK